MPQDITLSKQSLIGRNEFHGLFLSDALASHSLLAFFLVRGDGF